MVASFAGFVTLMIAHNLALGGDTMEMMRAARTVPDRAEEIQRMAAERVAADARPDAAAQLSLVEGGDDGVDDDERLVLLGDGLLAGRRGRLPGRVEGHLAALAGEARGGRGEQERQECCDLVVHAFL